MAVDASAPILQLTGVSKRYGGVSALDGVDFACRAGSIHAILGENGAGKSTLIKIIAGVVRPDSGTLRLDGEPVQLDTPQQATEQGIVCIFQELSLMPDLSVADNISITDPPRNRLGLIDRRAQRRRAEALLARVGCADLNPLELVRSLPLSRRQMVEIAKALGRQPRILILDEATSALTAADVEKVYANRVLEQLRDEGLALLYISHRMHEIEALADTCSVFRNGRHVETFAKGARGEEEIVQMMIGREVSSVFPPKPAPEAARLPVLEVEGLGWNERLHDISFTLGEGEIVGLGGLDGQGQRELLLALFGVLRGVEGSLRIDGRGARVTSTGRAKAAGMALIPEDRKTEGLMLPMSIGDNISIVALGRMTRGLVIDRGLEARKIAEVIEQLRIKLERPEDPAATLSGGNQQKLVIAKWLLSEARIILLNDPTRGIDVGTKQELYQLLRVLADDGASILFYTTDYDELIGCCDRVLMLYQGRILRELTGTEINETNIIASALNIELGRRPGPALGAVRA